MDALHERAIAYLRENGCRFQREESENLLSFAAEGSCGRFPVFLYARTPFLICMAKLPWRIPDCCRLEVAEFLHRVNFGLLLGNFEMDYEEGEVRFRTALMSEDGAVTPGVLDRTIQMPAAMLDRYAAGMEAIVFRGEIASQAVRQVEGD